MSRSATRPVRSGSGSVLRLHPKRILHHRVRVPSSTLPFASTPPQPPPKPVAAAVFLRRPDPHATERLAWNVHRYDSKTRRYSAHYFIPYMRPSAPASVHAPPALLERLYIYVHFHGPHERAHYVHTFCRVQEWTVRVLLFPGVMSERERLDTLQHMAQQATGDAPATPPAFVDVYAPEDIDRLVSRARHPKSPAYMEPPTPSNGTASAAHAPATHFRPDRRQQRKTIDAVDFFGGARLNVVELTASHVVDTGISLFGQSVQTLHPQSIRRLLDRGRTQLQAYLRDPSRLAVVAVLPRSHQKVLRLGAGATAANTPERFDRVVAVALFTFVPYQTARGRPTHVRLDTVLVDYAYDELLANVPQRDERYGVHANFVRVAMRYALHVGDDHDVVYDVHEDWVRALMRQVGLAPVFRENSFEALLLRCGFVAMPRLSDPPSDPPADGPARTWSEWFRQWYQTLRQRGTLPPLVYSALTVDCTQTWKACVRRVRELHPNKPLTQQLRIASQHYDPAGTTQRRRPKRPTRSHRRVTPAQGAHILRTYYMQKFLRNAGDPEAIAAAIAAGTPAGTAAPVTGTAHENAGELATLVDAYCKAIRHHLRHTQSSRRVLTAAAGDTWKYRPDPLKPVLPSTTAGGPDSYYLEGLNMHTAVGAQLYAYPLGRRHTPPHLVERPPSAPVAAPARSSRKRSRTRSTTATPTPTRSSRKRSRSSGPPTPPPLPEAAPPPAPTDGQTPLEAGGTTLDVVSEAASAASRA